MTSLSDKILDHASAADAAGLSYALDLRDMGRRLADLECALSTMPVLGLLMAPVLVAIGLLSWVVRAWVWWDLRRIRP